MIRLGLVNIPKLGFQNVAKHPTQSMIITTLNLQATTPSMECKRTTTFFNKLNMEAFWKSNNTVSNPGKKRGRGKSLNKKPTTLRKGHIGYGKEMIRWPGLNERILSGKDIVTIEKISSDAAVDEQTKPAVDKSVLQRKKRSPIHPLERGWAGKSILGKSLGPPDIIENNEGFDSYVLETKFLKLSDGKLGRIRSNSAFVVVGNGKGLIGLSSAKGANITIAYKRAVKKASKKLIYIKLEDGHTVNHDFFYQFGFSKLFVYKKPQGFGLVCNRGIALCCKLLGITDLYAKVEGSTNQQTVIKAFLLGLLEQKSYQQMADENKLHLVEQREEMDMFPVVKASPSEVLPKRDEYQLFIQYVMKGKLPLSKEKQPPAGYLPSYAKYLKRMYYQRNHKEVRLNLMAEYGVIKSHLTEIYPECKPPLDFLITKGRKETSET